MAGRLIYDEGRGEGCVGWAGARRPAFVGRFSDRAATGPHHPPCRARAVPRARPAAQARPGVSGRASTGTVATGPGRTRARPKQRATGWAGGPRAARPNIVFDKTFSNGKISYVTIVDLAEMIKLGIQSFSI